MGPLISSMTGPRTHCPGIPELQAPIADLVCGSRSERPPARRVRHGEPPGEHGPEGEERRCASPSSSGRQRPPYREMRKEVGGFLAHSARGCGASAPDPLAQVLKRRGESVVPGAAMVAAVIRRGRCPQSKACAVTHLSMTRPAGGQRRVDGPHPNEARPSWQRGRARGLRSFRTSRVIPPGPVRHRARVSRRRGPRRDGASSRRRAARARGG